MNANACDISFREKVRIFSHDYLKSCRYIAVQGTAGGMFTKRLYSQLIATSQVLEDFLDFHGAKHSEEWFLYRELTAAIRHISLGAYSQKHILNRLIFYDVGDTKHFRRAGEKTQEFLNQALIKLTPDILAEAKRLEIPCPQEVYQPEDFPGITTNEMLAYDIDDQLADIQKKQTVKIASEFLDIAAHLEHMCFYEPYDYEGMMAIVPSKVNEVEVRQFEMLVHNLQSSFDTYVMHGGRRVSDVKLRALRSHFSVVFHLFQLMGRLLHFYERHLLEVGYKDTYRRVRDRLAGLIDPAGLLDRTVNYGLYYACHFLNSGRETAREILNENIERGQIQVGIPMKLGFHSRPSLLVAKIVQHYGGEVILRVGEDKFDASSVLDIQWAGGKIQKEEVSEVVFEGDLRALKDIEILASVNYGEDTMGKGVPLPQALKYLR
ncbi:MAG: HPr family phosphocarrier protein [Desulfosarcinaceae bacterium]|nr:HPr family phosphocarrier protein [Desulfosarcinaceae bacterium]